MKPNSVGRKYQHIEDLICTHGSHGAFHSVERLAHIAANPSSLEVKWDGNPVIYWGKQHGKFIMMTKNAWDYYKRGTRMLEHGIPIVPSTPDDVKRFILATGEKGSFQRAAYATAISKLWPLLEEVSPESGFLEGSFIVSPMSPATEYSDSFQSRPNITLFEVLKLSELGSQFGSLTAIIAATGFYDSIGAFVEKRAPVVVSSSIKVLQTSYLNIPSIQLEVGEAVDFINEKKDDIDSFLESKPLFKHPGEVVYQFLNAVQRREYIIHLFKEWSRDKLSKQRLSIINQHVFGLVSVLQVIEKITALKNKILESSSGAQVGDIIMRNPEGFVQPHPGCEFQHDIPDQFIKLIDQRKWIPRK